ncbi:MAG: hypothetical protein R2856_26380 [Caldilineaceae bacterium]
MSATTVYGGIYDGVPVNQPRDVAVDSAGNRYLLDTGNNRVVVLDPVKLRAGVWQ